MQQTPLNSIIYTNNLLCRIFIHIHLLIVCIEVKTSWRIGWYREKSRLTTWCRYVSKKKKTKSRTAELPMSKGISEYYPDTTTSNNTNIKIKLNNVGTDDKSFSTETVAIAWSWLTITYAISAYHHYRWEFESRSWRGVFDTTLCDQVCQWLPPDLHQ
jgi:hypothetical protein